MRFVESLREGLGDAFREDSKAFLLGEDVLDPYGGAFKVTQGLSSAYPDRVLTTPISEAGIVGVAVGMALRGFHPVVEIMFGDFLTLAADQIVNHAAKFGTMYGQALDVPLVVRTAVGAGRGYGPTHSQSLESLFQGVPGLRIVAPSHVHRCGSLLQRAIVDDPMPVLFVEHKLLYPMTLAEPEDLDGATIPEASGYPTAVVRNFAAGAADVTLVAYGGMSRVAVEALDTLAAEEIRADLVLPATVSPLPGTALFESARRTGRVVVIGESPIAFGWTAEVAAQLYGELWRELKTPIVRVGACPTVIPAAKHLEERVIVTPGRIVEAALGVVA